LLLVSFGKVLVWLYYLKLLLIDRMMRTPWP